VTTSSPVVWPATARAGRLSGRRRFVVLEVVGHPARDTYLVVSGFGGRAQWFRNIQVNPHVRLYVRSRGPVPAKACILTPEQTRAALVGYAAARPRTWAALKPVPEHTLSAEVGDLPMVALHLVRGQPRARQPRVRNAEVNTATVAAAERGRRAFGDDTATPARQDRQEGP
jgi:deazaflavin-dependent oxidoreductase (nitroreductase family)